VLRQHRRKAASGSARARIITPEFLDEFCVDANDAVAALDVGLARGNPRRRLLVGSKDASASRSRYMAVLLVWQRATGS
jgi:hypothetical protein